MEFWYADIENDPGLFWGDDDRLYRIKDEGDFREAWNMREVASVGGWVDLDDTFDATIKDRCLAAFDGKTTARKAAVKIGVSFAVVYKHWKRAGLAREKASEAEILKAFDGKTSATKIAKLLGTTVERVSRSWKKSGLKKNAAVDNEAVLKAFHEGGSLRTVSKRLGISRRTVSKYWKKAGLI